MNVTAKQVVTLDVLHSFIALYGYPPTIRELAERLGIKPTAAYSRIMQLERRGLIEWPERGGGGIKRATRTMRILG